MDQNDIKRADILLKKDPLINEAMVQGRITREELILFIDYYEIFSITNKAKKFTMEHVKALDDLCLKNKKQENEEKLNAKKVNKNNIDLNDEDAINKLTREIEKKLETSEDILNKKLDYEKMMMSKNNNINSKNENFKNILDKYNKEKGKKENKNKSDKDNISNVTEKTEFTNFVNFDNKNDNFDYKVNTIKTSITNDEKRPSTTKSNISTFTTEELMSVPKYTLYKNKNEKNSKSNSNSSSKINQINNNTFYKNIQANNKSNENEISYKPKTPLKPISKDKIKNSKNNISNNSNNISNSSISINTGKKLIPPIKNSGSLKSKSNQRVDLFDDNGNPLNMGKFRGARKELVKLKMGGKSKMHELFTNKPRNAEENEKLRQKFMDFIQTGKENNKNYDANPLKKSIIRKKIEDAQQFNKYKK